MSVIGDNFTRYSTDDLQALLTEVERFCLGTSGQIRSRTRTVSQIEVAYWSGNPETYRRYGNWSNLDRGPWFTSSPDNNKSDRLLILGPEKVVALLPPMEQLAAMAESPVMGLETKFQVALLMAARMGYSAKSTPRGYVHGMKKLGDLLRSSPQIGDVQVRVLKNLGTKRQKGPSKDYIRSLWSTFNGGLVRRELRSVERTAIYALQEYEHLLPRLEVQRQRLVVRGEEVEELPTVVGLLEDLLQKYKSKEGK
jgi:hypothetical protein